MKSILREYIRAALVLNEADDEYTTSSALISGLKTAVVKDAMPAELAGLVAAANNVIEKNLDAYLAEAQAEIDKLGMLDVIDMGQEDLASIYRSISALLASDASELDNTNYPIRTALYLIALDENMPNVFESTSDFLSSVVSQLGELMPGESPSIQVPAQNENRNSAYSTISEGAIWDGIKKGAEWLAGKTASAGVTTGGAAKSVGKVITAPSNTGYKKLARFIGEYLDDAIKDMPDTLKLNAGKAISKAQDAVMATDPENLLLRSDIAYSINDLKAVAADLLNTMGKNSSKTVENLTDAEIEIALRARLPDELDALLATNADLVAYVKEALRLASDAAGGTARFMANFGPTRVAFLVGSTIALALGVDATAAALEKAGTIAPNSSILKADFVALVTFEKLAAKGASAAESVGNKLNNADVYGSVIDFNAFGAAFATLVDYMRFNPNRKPILLPTDLEELSARMSDIVSRVGTKE